MPDFIIHTGEQMLALMNEINHLDLLMQYDIYHMHMMQEDSNAFEEAAKTKKDHIQFADCPGRHQPGTGTIDYHKLFSIIKASSYKGWVGAEYIPSNNTQASLNWLKEQA